jgi:pectinesterase inhibitor-like protein
MDSINSFKGYGKVDPIEEEAFRRKNRKRIIIIILSAIILGAVIIGVVAGTLIHRKNNESTQIPSSQMTPASSIKSVCRETRFPESCITSLSALDTSNTTDPEELFKLSLRVVMNSLHNLSSLPESLKSRTSDEKMKMALDVCGSVIDDAIDHLNDSISFMDTHSGGKILSPAKIEDLKTWLSSTITDQETCLDALQEMNLTIPEDLNRVMKNSTEYASNSLAIVAKILGILADFDIPVHRKLLGFPDWVGAGDRRLLQEVKPTPDVIVASDGTGDCLTIREAVGRIPKKNTSRFVIYIKAGEYVGNEILDKSLWNVMMYGDGKDKTILSGSLNYIDGTPTFSTATFAVVGRNFMAKDITFKNTAGAAKHQAVAMRSGSDHSVFYRCSFDGFQDTLYAHSNRQFYRDCDITGTIDFIFGNSAVVFQNCTIMPRQPLAYQFVTITAQGKKDPNQNTGISIQKCTISPLDALTAATYLGRPWKEYSTTVIMQTEIGAFLRPSGWIEWVSNVIPPSTILYAEYENTGPGSAVDQRVTWPGYKPTMTFEQANKFTVDNFLQGAEWLPATNVAFQSSL